LFLFGLATRLKKKITEMQTSFAGDAFVHY
jgi:hypothetical protein